MFNPSIPPPKPTPKNIQSSLHNAFSNPPPKHKPPTTTHRHSRPAPRATATTSSHGPSLSTVLQKTAAATNVVRPKPRERVIKAFECASSFDDDVSPPPTSSAATNTSPKIKSQLTALHEAVFFDEGDFDDDQDLNFDDTIIAAPKVKLEPEETPIAYSASPTSFCIPTPPPPTYFLPPSLRRKSPTLVKKEYSSTDEEECTVIKIESSQPQQGSSPFPWSSSPVEHFAPLMPLPRQPAREQAPQRQQQRQQQASPPLPPQPQQTSKQMKVIDLREDDDEPEMPKKKRKFPWEKEGEAADAGAAPPSRTARTAGSTRAERAPAPQKPPILPWDMTASDFKRAPRKKVEQQRRGMGTLAKDGAAAVGEKKKQKKLRLSNEQMHVLDLVLESGKSVFFTGSAGTGKSVLMREVISDLRTKYSKNEECVAVTASTGLAACNIGGVTLHSFAGIGLGKEPVPDLVKKIKRNVKARTRWLRTKVLIIDEISMVDGELFDKLEAIARVIRNNGRAFGGIQLVVTGDFFQLPPVPDYGKVAKFAFDANTWTTTIEHTIGLTQVFRQRDPEFAAILNEMRLGKLSTDSVAVFHGLSRPLIYDDGIQATELFPTRQEVDAANNSKMRLLSGVERKFVAVDIGTIIDVAHRTKLLSTCMAPQVICLKINSQVMLIKNLDETLVNGSLGRVVGFMSEKTFDMAQDDPDSLTIETPALNKPLDRLTNSTADEWPLVEFALPDGTSRQLLVQPETWKVELPSGEVQASRTQVPLILAWALSIHKAQGQTLERVKVDLGRVFEKGQAYVALSRATCQSGLEVRRFDATKVMAHEKVREFYKSLYSAAEAKARKVEVGAMKVKEETKTAERRGMQQDEVDEDGYDVLRQAGGSGA